MRSLTGLILASALASATPILGQEMVTGGDRGAAPVSPAPKPLIPREQAERDKANADWAQNILDGKPNASEAEKAAQAACPSADTKPFGEVRMSVGTGGYKSTGFTMVKPLKGCGEIAVSADWTDGGNSGFRRR